MLTEVYNTTLSVNQAIWRRMIQCQVIMNCKDMEGRHRVFSTCYSAICPEEINGTTKVSG
jgi:hypothetical protein